MYLQCQNFRFALNPIITGPNYMIIITEDIIYGHFKHDNGGITFNKFKIILKGHCLKAIGKLMRLPSIIGGEYGIYKSVELQQIDAIPTDCVSTDHWVNDPFGKVFRMAIDCINQEAITPVLKRRITMAKKRHLDWIFVGDQNAIIPGYL